MKSETKTIPGDATQFATPMQFAEHDTTEDLPNVFPVTLFARSTEPVSHPYWGRIVHDMEGMTHPESIQIDHNHDTYSGELGFCNEFDITDDGLQLSGGLISTSQLSVSMLPDFSAER